ncbi:MAG: hypothetical protein D6675_14125 [Gemmatimonadetes bacterium]|nr:MAG: hypothetical protein D6675_14125 [Gemmatimonadota bacterium]
MKLRKKLRINNVLVLSGLFLLLRGNSHAQPVESILDIQQYGWQTKSERQIDRDQVRVMDTVLAHYQQQQISIKQVRRRAMVYPGLGHFRLGQTRKGWLFGGVETLALGSALLFYHHAQTHYTNYKTARTLNDIQQQYDQAQTNYYISQGLWIGAAILWLYNIYDAQRSARQLNQALFETLVNQALDPATGKLQFQLQPRAVEVSVTVSP